ncbi:MAG: adenylate/guanylate cyclase domain-containing protein [bacterium]
MPASRYHQTCVTHRNLDGDASGNRCSLTRLDGDRFGGREIETGGDSFLVVFDGAERAIRCALALVEALAAIRIPIRVGIHSGEVVSSGDQVRGVAVHTAARILAEAGAGEVLVSGSTRDLAEGATGLTFDSRGSYALQGLEREHELFAAGSSAEAAPA